MAARKSPSAKPPKRVPFEFVLDELAPLTIRQNPMFGSTALYEGARILFILRDRESLPADNGVWIATTAEHHASLRAELPSLRSITAFGSGETGWQVLPSSAPSFEREVRRACELAVAHDPRVGKVPNSRKKALTKRPSKSI